MVFASLIVLVFSVELVIAGWSRSSLRRLLDFDKSAWLDMVATLIEGFRLVLPLMIVYTFGGAFLLAAIPSTKELVVVSGVAAVGLYYIGMLFLDYWQHRLFHTKWLWPLYRFHHSATSMGPLTAYRHHPAHSLVIPVCQIGVLAFIDVDPVAMTVIAPLMAVHQLVVHLNQDWDWGWFGKWVLASPAVHRIHHSSDPAHAGKNLSLLPILDHMFGTWYEGSQPVKVLGIEGPSYHPLMLPFNWLRDSIEVLYPRSRRVNDGAEAD